MAKEDVGRNKEEVLLLLVFLVDSFIFLRSGWGKIISGDFPENLGGTLVKFASQNPYPWNKDFLLNIAVPNSVTLGYLVMLGEVFTGLTLFLGALYVLFVRKISLGFKGWLMLGAIIGAFLNLMFYLSTGWMSASNDGLNLLMLVVELVAVVFIWQLPTERKTLFK